MRAMGQAASWAAERASARVEEEACGTGPAAGRVERADVGEKEKEGEKGERRLPGRERR